MHFHSEYYNFSQWHNLGTRMKKQYLKNCSNLILHTIINYFSITIYDFIYQWNIFTWNFHSAIFSAASGAFFY